MKNYQLILTTLLSYSIAWSIMNGTAQEVVPFAGPLNELAVTILALTMGTMCLFGINFRGLIGWLRS